MKLLYSCTVFVEKHIAKKNTKRIFFNKSKQRFFLGNDSKMLKIEDKIIRELKQAKLNDVSYPINVPILCEFTFGIKNYYKKPKSKKNPINERSKKIHDLSNLYEMIQDCLTEAGIIEDDRLIEAHDGSRRIPSETNFIKIKIFGPFQAELL